MAKVKKLPPELATLIQVAEGLQQTLGRQSEVVVHDFRNPDRSVIAIAGRVTGREVGAPLTDRLLEMYRKYGDEAPNVINVRTRLKDGRLLRSSTVFIRDTKGKIVGSIGINLDQTEYEIAVRALGEVLGQSSEQPMEIDFGTDVSATMHRLIESALAQIGLDPRVLGREERLSLIQLLDSRGLFLIRGAVEEVAARLGVSRFTVYGYLDDVRRSDQDRTE